MAPWEEYQAAAVADPTAIPSLKPWEEYTAADAPTFEPQIVSPEEDQPADEYDQLYYKTGKTKSEREALNRPLREAMQVPAVSPETVSKGLQAVSEIGATDPEDLQQGPVQQGINESVAKAISGMTTGEGAASLPLYMFPPTAVGLQAESTADLPAQVQDAIQRAQQGDIKGAASTGTDALLNALMTAGVVHGGAKFMGGERVPTPLQAEPTLAERITQPRVEPPPPVEVEQPGPTGFSATMREPWETPPEAPPPVTPETPTVPEVPLGLHRPIPEISHLSNLPEQHFDIEHRSASQALDAIERDFDNNPDHYTGGSPKQQAMAEAQDRYQAVQLERFRREIVNRHPGDLFKDFSDEAARLGDPDTVDITTSEGAAKLKLMLDELKRQQPTDAELAGGWEHLRGTQLASDPNFREVQGYKAQLARKWADKLSEPPAPEAPPPVTPAQRNRQILERRQGILDRKAELTARAANGEQGLEGHLAAVEAELNDPVTNPVVHAPPVEAPVRSDEFAKPGYTALETPPEAPTAEVPQTPVIPPEDARYAGVEPIPQAFSDEPHVSAIANRFTAERAAAGELGEIAPGESINTMDLVHHGLKMPPEQVNESISRVMQGGDVPIKDAAALRGEEARLSQRSGELSRAARANPADVQAQLAADNAFKDLTDFHNGPVAQAKRNWHHQGKLMQGEIPVDLSTLNGMREAWLKDTGKPPPAHVEPKLQKAADRLARAIDEERTAARNGGEAIEKATRGRKMPTVEEVRNNIAERMKVEPCIV